ncbi:MAG TPA: ATP cone domain-containing protein [Methanomassiliicoccales archaeon]|nr:ATP cone domain-containing protein [Methanomassiliicoccales archaeon]
MKRSGEREQFDHTKTKNAVMRAGMPESEADEVVEALVPQLYDGITTEEIYRRVHDLLKGRRQARYGLKKAILRLGPEGENFERFIARLFQADGFETRNRVMMQGKCVQHEVDVLMRRGTEDVMVECKFHNSLGIKCAIQCALYTHARFNDLTENGHLDHAILVTNTRFTSDVERYAACVGMRLLGWHTPEGNGIEEKVERHHLYPITLIEMRRHDLVTLLEAGIIMTSEVLESRDKVQRLLSREAAEDIVRQAEELAQ